jgi:hypothetical protein
MSAMRRVRPYERARKASPPRSHVLWDGVQDSQDPNAVFKLAFDKLRIRDLTCAS